MMASSSTLISYYAITKLFENESKLLKRGENALRSGHLESCSFDASSGVIHGKVHASMRDKLYDVQVRLKCFKACSVWNSFLWLHQGYC